MACLHAITKFCRDSPVIVYSDKLYIHSSHTTKMCDLFIVLVGMGFIPGALLIFKSNQTMGDYHKEMNSDNYMQWVLRRN